MILIKQKTLFDMQTSVRATLQNIIIKPLEKDGLFNATGASNSIIRRTDIISNE